MKIGYEEDIIRKETETLCNEFFNNLILKEYKLTSEESARELGKFATDILIQLMPHCVHKIEHEYFLNFLNKTVLKILAKRRPE